MSKPYRVIQIGLGTIGRPIAEAILNRENLSLVAAMDINPEFIGKKITEIVGTNKKSSVNVRGGLDEVLGTAADVALIATSSSLKAVKLTILKALDAGLNVVSICEELSYPFKRHPDLSKELDLAAKEVGRSILGTGINPGYLMDILPILLTAPCQAFETVRVTRCIDSSKRRMSFQKKIGTGMTKKEFSVAISEGAITGHVGLTESIHMIGDALRLDLDLVEEIPPEPVIADAEVTTPFTTITPGNVLGLRSRGVGKRKDETIVTLDFNAYAEANPEYDEVIVNGFPKIQQRIEGGVMGDHGTVAMAINTIPLVVQARAGLLTMKDLPCPRNTQFYFRE
ncbi:MAG: dihydrodipicolinate reductase [Promethearchaeota archaeon]